MNFFRNSILTYQTIWLVFVCVQSSIFLCQCSFRRLSYKYFGLSCEAQMSEAGDITFIRHAYCAPQVELRRPAQERWSEEYIGRGILSQAAATKQQGCCGSSSASNVQGSPWTLFMCEPSPKQLVSVRTALATSSFCSAAMHSRGWIRARSLCEGWRAKVRLRQLLPFRRKGSVSLEKSRTCQLLCRRNISWYL